jgi:WD40 repeat protein
MEYNRRQSILISTVSGYLGLWDLADKRQFWSQMCDGPVISAEPNSNNEIISLSKKGLVAVWDIEKESKKISFTGDDPAFCNLIQLHDGRDGSPTMIALAGREFGQVNVYDVSSGKFVMKLTADQPQERGMVMCLQSLMIDGCQYVLGGCEDGSLLLWDTRQNDKDISHITIFSEPMMCLDYNLSCDVGACGCPLETLETFHLSQEVHQWYHYPIVFYCSSCLSFAS